MDHQDRTTRSEMVAVFDRLVKAVRWRERSTMARSRRRAVSSAVQPHAQWCDYEHGYKRRLCCGCSGPALGTGSGAMTIIKTFVSEMKPDTQPAGLRMTANVFGSMLRILQTQPKGGPSFSIISYSCWHEYLNAPRSTSKGLFL